MIAHSLKSRCAGFSLIEVIIAMGIVGFIIPVILGVQATFSYSSTRAMDRSDVASMSHSLELYLNGRVPDPSSSATVPFSTVYGWVYAARQAPGKAQVIYGYKANASHTDYIFSQSPPTGNVEGRLLAIEILAPEQKVLPDDLLGSDSATYSKACLPLKVSVHVLADPFQKRTAGTFMDAYPVVVSR